MSETTPKLFEYALRLGDDALVLGHRLSEWIGFAPVLEEELALGNIALDNLDLAQAALTLAAEVEGAGRDADALAYSRDDTGFRNALLVEQPNHDFAWTVARQALFAAFALPNYRALAKSAEPRLAAIGAKAARETEYHARHARSWVLRLGDGTSESRARMQAAFDELFPYLGELLEVDAVTRELAAAGIAPNPSAFDGEAHAGIAALLRDATLVLPASGAFAPRGGRSGRHSEHLSRMLAEMQVVARAHPGAKW
jgi:ring-1,2-phenylacetyl-CoA epoxidase subunit PaaC